MKRAQNYLSQLECSLLSYINYCYAVEIICNHTHANTGILKVSNFKTIYQYLHACSLLEARKQTIIYSLQSSGITQRSRLNSIYLIDNIYV